MPWGIKAKTLNPSLKKFCASSTHQKVYSSQIAQGNRQKRELDNSWKILKFYHAIWILYFFPRPYMLSFQNYTSTIAQMFSPKGEKLALLSKQIFHTITKSSLFPGKLQNQGLDWSKRKMQQMTYTGMGWIKRCCFRKKGTE